MDTIIKFERSAGEPEWCHLLVSNLGTAEAVDLLKEPDRAVDNGRNLLAQMDSKSQNKGFVKKLVITWDAIRITVGPPFGTGNPLKRLYEDVGLIIEKCIEQAQAEKDASQLDELDELVDNALAQAGDAPNSLINSALQGDLD